MNISSNIKFSGLDQTKFIKKGDSGFKELKEINQSGDWIDYINQMTEEGISVNYDYSSDSFRVTPYLVQLKESFGIEDEYEEDSQPLNVMSVDDVKDVFKDFVSDSNKTINDNFEKLRNEIFDKVDQSETNEFVVDKQNKEKVNDEDLLLGDYDSPSFTTSAQSEPHPDLVKYLKKSDLAQSSPIIENSDEEVILNNHFDTPVQEPMTSDGIMNVNGIKVKLILTGVLITESEIKTLVHEAKLNGLNPLVIKGKGENIKFLCEKQNKERVIIKISDDQYQSPFKVNGYNFNYLTEACKFAAKDLNHLKEKELKLLQESKIRNEKTTFIESKKIESTLNPNWNVLRAGVINLKDGFNNSLGKLTEQKHAFNTLVKTEKNEFVLFKGSLNERTKLGTKARLIENTLKESKELGTVEVVGTFENSLEGFGKIMYETKRTNIPLLVWK